MCGLFGLIRSEEALHPERASAVLIELGNKAVERGSDSAGFALITPSSDMQTTFDKDAYKAACIEGDLLQVYRAAGSFSRLWDDSIHLPALTEAKVVIGHTRSASQGSTSNVVNMSPMIVDNRLVVTHNGDVDTTTIPVTAGSAKGVNGGTDTEKLFYAISDRSRDRRKIVEVLSKVEGRVSAAWLDAKKMDRVYLARAALAPLVIAVDTEKNMYWSSNPQWFRDIAKQFGGFVEFESIIMVREGTLLTVNTDAPVPYIADSRSFTGRCRSSDESRDYIVWRGWVKTDEEADKAQANHDTAPPKPYSSAWSGGYGSTYSGSSSSRSGGSTYSNYRNSDAAARTSGKTVVPFGGSTYESDPDLIPVDGSMDVDDIEYWANNPDADIDCESGPADGEMFDSEDQALALMIDWMDDGCKVDKADEVLSADTPEAQQAVAKNLGITLSVFSHFRNYLSQYDGEVETFESDTLVESD